MFHCSDRSFETFCFSQGWGHVIDGSDVWKATKWKNGTKWDFYGAQADQVSCAKQKAIEKKSKKKHSTFEFTNFNISIYPIGAALLLDKILQKVSINNK